MSVNAAVQQAASSLATSSPIAALDRPGLPEGILAHRFRSCPSKALSFPLMFPPAAL